MNHKITKAWLFNSVERIAIFGEAPSKKKLVSACVNVQVNAEGRVRPIVLFGTGVDDIILFITLALPLNQHVRDSFCDKAIRLRHFVETKAFEHERFVIRYSMVKKVSK